MQSTRPFADASVHPIDLFFLVLLFNYPFNSLPLSFIFSLYVFSVCLTRNLDIGIHDVIVLSK